MQHLSQTPTNLELNVIIKKVYMIEYIESNFQWHTYSIPYVMTA